MLLLNWQHFEKQYDKTTQRSYQHSSKSLYFFNHITCSHDKMNDSLNQRQQMNPTKRNESLGCLMNHSTLWLKYICSLSLLIFLAPKMKKKIFKYTFHVGNSFEVCLAFLEICPAGFSGYSTVPSCQWCVARGLTLLSITPTLHIVSLFKSNHPDGRGVPTVVPYTLSDVQ